MKGTTGRQDIRRLIAKYRARRVPKLTDTDDPENGLIDPNLLNLLVSGLTTKLGTFVDVSLTGPKPLENAWDMLRFPFSGARVAQCDTAQSSPSTSSACEECIRSRTDYAQHRREAIAFLCPCGMLGFAAPVIVANQVVAVCLSAKGIPRAGRIWNAESPGDDAPVLPLLRQADGLDLRSLSMTRMEAFPAPWAVPQFSARPGSGFQRLSPQEIADFLEEFARSVSHIAALADSSYLREKQLAASYWPALLLRCVPISRTPIVAPKSLTNQALRRASTVVSTAAADSGIDGVLLLQLHPDKKAVRWLVSCGPGDAPPLGEWLFPPQDVDFSLVRDGFDALPCTGDFHLPTLRDRPLFRHIVRRFDIRKGQHCISRKRHVAGLSSCLLLAFRRGGLRQSDLADSATLAFQQLLDALYAWARILLCSEADEMPEIEYHFLEDVAHDIRNPIQSALLKMELIKSTRDPKVLGKHVKRLRALIMRVHLLSEKLWLLAQLREPGTILESVQRVPVFQTIMESVHSVEDLAQERHVSIFVDEAFQRWRMIDVDRKFLIQALVNLLDNAVKYAHPNSTVYVRGSLRYPAYTISVSDLGIGINKEEMTYLFDRGFRGRQAREYLRQGSGLGLCIVKAFADAFGRVDVNCAPHTNGGFITTFTLQLVSGGRT